MQLVISISSFVMTNSRELIFSLPPKSPYNGVHVTFHWNNKNKVQSSAIHLYVYNTTIIRDGVYSQLCTSEKPTEDC